MIPVTQLFYRQLPIVFKVEHSDQKSPVMETLEMAQSGQVIIISVLEAAKLVMAVSIRLQQALSNTVVAATFKAVTTLGSGVIGVVAMVL